MHNGIEGRMSPPENEDIQLAQVYTDQQFFRQLGLARSLAGETDNPARELSAVNALIAFCLRKLQKYVGEGKDDLSQTQLNKWRRRIRVAGSVSVSDNRVQTGQGQMYRIESTCQSVETQDGECPRFKPITKTVFRDEREASMRDEEKRVTRWQVSVLSELEAELEMQLARFGWDKENFGPEDSEVKEARQEVRATVRGGG